MKPSLLILFALATTLPMLALAAEPEPVVDTNGDAVYSGGKYYVLPKTPTPIGAGGGLFQGRTDGSECPLTVLQDYYPSKRLAVKFMGGVNSEVINTDTPLGIEFADILVGPCSRIPPTWLVFDSEAIRSLYVGIGNVVDHPGANHITPGYFQIEKYGSGYKLVFCFAGIRPNVCFDIGRKDDEEGRRLVVNTEDSGSGVPYEIQFEKRVEDDANNGRSIV